ncbi:MAG: RNA 2',3'-cyclic phosphodiesterase [Acidobacteria bacterium]|nr:MAG: RNA 2',3'-cyclic phosphodiesterase [Acidobacteriota bacterium]
MIRSFIAVSLPGEVRGRLEQYGKELKQLGLDGSFPKSESFHLTLKFLGNIPEQKVDEIGDALERAVAGVAPLQVSVRGLGVFPGASNPRVVWIGFEHSELLKALQERVDRATEAIGFPGEDRPFRPHLTLARLKSKANLKALQEYLKESGAGAAAGAVPVEEVILFRSDLRPDGARYTRLRSVRLQGEPEHEGE